MLEDSLVRTDALLNLLFEICCATSSSEDEFGRMFLGSSLASFLGDRFPTTFFERAHMLSELQRSRRGTNIRFCSCTTIIFFVVVAPILHRCYLRFPSLRAAYRRLYLSFLQYVSKTASSDQIAALIETNEFAQAIGEQRSATVDDDDDEEEELSDKAAGRRMVSPASFALTKTMVNKRANTGMCCV
jgi:hypothetical protein